MRSNGLESYDCVARAWKGEEWQRVGNTVVSKEWQWNSIDAMCAERALDSDGKLSYGVE